MNSYYIHLFCLDESKYGTTPELILGPFEGIGFTWGFIRGYTDESSPPDDHIILVDNDVLRLCASGLAEKGQSFYSDFAIFTQDEFDADTSGYLKSLPLYQHPEDIVRQDDAEPSWCDTHGEGECA